MHNKVKNQSVIVALLVPLFASSAFSANIQFGNAIPGTIIQKDVQSIRERRYENLIEQQTDFSCGAAAVATILKYAYGQDVTELEVLEGMLKVADVEEVQRRGFSLLDIKNYIESIGMRARGYQIDSETLDGVSIPTIVLLDIKGYKHFVIMKKASDDRVYVGDPALGNRIMDREEFLKSWNNIVFAVIGSNFDRNTVLLNPAQPLTARKLHDVFAPVPKHKLIDFGFRNADFF